LNSWLTYRWFWPLAIAVVLLNCYLIYSDQWLLSLLPFALIVAFLAIFRFDFAVMVIAFSAPLSFNIEYITDGKIGLFIPTEPLLAMSLALIIAKQIAKPFIDRAILNHPIAWVVYVYLFWIGMTTITSTDILVSIKYLIVRLWFIIPIMFLGAQLFLVKERIRLFFWLYAIGMSIVILYTLINHSLYSFGEKEGHWVMWPFFKDHTGYGAMVAFVIPILIGFYYSKKHSLLTQIVVIGLILLAFIGVYFSYTRAAWLSLFAAAGVLALIKFKIPFKYLAGLGVIAILIIALNWDQINMEMARNKSEHTIENFDERLQSATNVTTDASNLERINRWTAAWNMAMARPIVGFGPGTYAMEYAPYQNPENYTIISTNLGTMGNAHSEYLGPMSEMGFPGLIIMLLLVAIIFYKGITLYIRYPDGEFKTLLLSLILAMVTYFVHGFLNNYLDTDKAAVPIWGAVAAIIALEIQLDRKEYRAQ
jgi:putative inorganic carbon (HCO3(-)) transporter